MPLANAACGAEVRSLVPQTVHSAVPPVRSTNLSAIFPTSCVLPARATPMTSKICRLARSTTSRGISSYFSSLTKRAMTSVLPCIGVSHFLSFYSRRRAQRGHEVRGRFQTFSYTLRSLRLDLPLLRSTVLRACCSSPAKFQARNLKLETIQNFFDFRI